MKQITPFLVAAILLFSCPIATPSPVEVDTTNTAARQTHDAINTAAFQTAMDRITTDQTMTASVWTATYTPTYLPTSTQSPTSMPSMTPSTFPAEIESLLRNKCPMPWRSVFSVPIGSYDLTERYGDKGCILPTFSPDRKYLAYVTLDTPKDREKFVDAVKILTTDSQISQTVYFVHEMDIVRDLEWSPAGQLIIWESLWEGPFFILVYDLRFNSIMNTMRLNRDSPLGWNSGKTALYSEHSHGYGAARCIRELRGYDFAYGNSFPDFYEIFHLEKQANDPLGIPNGKTDDLAIEPFKWSSDGTILWITIIPLRRLENGDYELGPRQVGVLSLTAKEVVFKLLASDPNTDYSFSEAPVPTIVSSPYQPHRCP